MKKSFIGIFFLALFIGIFTGCGKKDEQVSDDIYDVTKDILDEVESSRKSAAEMSAERIKSSLESQYFVQMITNPDADIKEVIIDFGVNDAANNVYYGGEKLKDIIDGDLPVDGSIKISIDGEVSTVEGDGLVIDGYYCDVPNNGSATCNKINQSN